MSRYRCSLIASVAFAVTVGIAAPGRSSAQDVSGVQKVLQEQGRYWQTRNAERAAEVWQKLLLTDPDQVDALAGLGQLAVTAKKMDVAATYLARLRKAHPQSSLALQLEQDIAFGSDRAAAELDRARILLREQKFAEALAKYRTLFNGRAPQGKLGLEFYSVLGYAPGGWQEAVTGLMRLRAAEPAEPHIQLELANLQILRQETRLEGLRALMNLSRRPDVGGDATEHWRSALEVLGAPPPPVYAPYFQAYLKANPDDKDIRAQFAARAKPGAGGATGAPGPTTDAYGAKVAAGFDALQREEFDAAEKAFNDATRLRARHPSALGGLGLVRLRQKKFAQARTLLAEASRQGEVSAWKEALDSATYWDLVSRAGDAQQAGQADEARTLLEQAMRLDPGDAGAQSALASVYLALGRSADAERAYRDILARRPDDVDAVRGLVSVLRASNRRAEAIALVNTLGTGERERPDIRALRGEQATADYRAAVARGDLPGAGTLLDEALALSPDDPWLRLDLARRYLGEARSAEARQLLEELLARYPRQPDVLYTNALLRTDLNDWGGARDALDGIDPELRTAAMVALQRRAEVEVVTARARTLVQQGRKPDAAALLAQTVAKAKNDDAGLTASLAQALAAAGDPTAAMALVRRGLAAHPGALALRVQLAELLLQRGDDTEVAALLAQLERGPVPDEATRLYVASLRRSYVLRAAEALRVRGSRDAANALLAPVLAQEPDDPALLGLQARLYSDAGQPAQAVRVYRRILSIAPDDGSAWLSLALVSASQGDTAGAESAFGRARQIDPQNPDVLAGLGRVYRAQGRNAEAATLLRAAVAALEASRSAPTTSVQRPPARGTW